MPNEVFFLLNKRSNIVCIKYIDSVQQITAYIDMFERPRVTIFEGV